MQTICVLSCTTLAAIGTAPSGAARNIRVERISNTAVEVTWEDPVVEQTTLGGRITGYRVVIGNRKCTTELQTWTVQDNVNTVRFGSLEPGGRYCVRIYPFNNDGPAPENIVKDSAVTTKLPDLLGELHGPRLSVFDLALLC